MQHAQLRMTALLLCFASLVGALGCTQLSRWRWDQGELGSPWPVAGKDLAGSNALVSSGFSGQFDSLWNVSLRDKPVAPLVILDAALVYSSSKKRLRQFDLATGGELAQLRMAGSISASPIRHSDKMFVSVSQKSNRLAAFTQGETSTSWSFQVNDPSSGLIMTQGAVIATTGTGVILALNPETGDTLWTRRLGSPIRARLVGDSSRVVAVTDDGVVHSLQVQDGKSNWVQKLNSAVAAAPSLGSSVLIATIEGELIALDRASGAILWREKRTGAVWGGATSADTICVVGSGANGGEVVAVHVADGRELWRQKLHGVVRAAPMIVGEYVVAGTLRGWLYSMRCNNGTLVDSVKLDGAVEHSPITDGDRIYIATARGKVAAFGVPFGSRSAEHR